MHLSIRSRPIDSIALLAQNLRALSDDASDKPLPDEMMALIARLADAERKRSGARP
jgi:Anti-sigma factor NepR